MLASSSFPGNRLIAYLQTLAKTKTGLPYGLPVCVAPSHTITDSETLVQLADLVGPHAAIVQVHADIIDDWSDETVRQLTALAKKHAFLIWESGRILNATVDVVGRQKAESREVRNELVDLIRKKYTKGVIKLASWAVISTAWASGVAVNNQEADILIPTLKAAAREAVADAVQTIRTEITANSDSTMRPLSGYESTLGGDESSCSQHLSSDYAVDDGGLGLPPRKASTISLTQTITQHTEDSTGFPLGDQNFESMDGLECAISNNLTDHGLPTPPLLARGLILCLPSVIDTSFTADYRRSCVAAARANQDFVVGFLCSEPWHLVSQRDDIFDIEYRGCGEEQQLSPYSSDDEDQLPPLALFSIISHRLSSMRGKPLADYIEEEDEHTANNLDPKLEASSVDPENPLATKLFHIVGQALKFQKASRNGRDGVQPSSKPINGSKVLHIPVVSLP
ncbi:hypothetical protein FE257_012202 [Aspergillus nanangensis]|uniref:Orotidine 5'-phosphate decarboxylase domain-containing protein n=1 Tax=Aspergillus nanangensis TaxID=2582783 RepID=A0AAD4GQW6_ASPNN|nr:hypothetical protein FE257_012202 [Aspergillus nanangensis]